MSPEEPRLLLDEMLGKLARELRALGYDAAYAHGSEDEAILERAEREGRLLVTRDVQLADRAGSSALLLETRQVDEQLETTIERLELSPSPEAFLSRCLECNAELEAAQRPDRLPEDVPEQPHWACPSCDRVYWQGTHARDMLQRLGEHLPDDVDPERALDPLGDPSEGERKP